MSFYKIAMAKAKRSIVKIIPDETIIRKIHMLRGQKVILDRDLAELYGIETKVLNQSVKRNGARFPEDFMFRLTNKEAEISRSQFVTLKQGQNTKYLPFAFTEQGVAMLSGVINSAKAIEMNIAIMRAFVEMRNLVHDNKKIAEQIKALFERVGEHDVQLGAIYDAMENLMDEREDEKAEQRIKKENWTERERIGFKK
jgi:phage regulator Rha-like protein